MSQSFQMKTNTAENGELYYKAKFPVMYQIDKH